MKFPLLFHVPNKADMKSFSFCWVHFIMDMPGNLLVYRQNILFISCLFHKVSYRPLVEARSMISYPRHTLRTPPPGLRSSRMSSWAASWPLVL